MNDVNETLQQLVERRLREMGQRRGRGEQFSLHEAWERLPTSPQGKRAVSYETVRRIRENGHTRIGDATADALATMLDVPVGRVLAAAGQRQRLGPFDLPQRADRLTESERTAVLGVIDAILDAGAGVGQPSPSRSATTTRRAQQRGLPDLSRLTEEQLVARLGRANRDGLTERAQELADELDRRRRDGADGVRGAGGA